MRRKTETAAISQTAGRSGTALKQEPEAEEHSAAGFLNGGKRLPAMEGKTVEYSKSSENVQILRVETGITQAIFEEKQAKIVRDR